SAQPRHRGSDLSLRQGGPLHHRLITPSHVKTRATKKPRKNSLENGTTTRTQEEYPNVHEQKNCSEGNRCGRRDHRLSVHRPRPERHGAEVQSYRYRGRGPPEGGADVRRQG